MTPRAFLAMERRLISGQAAPKPMRQAGARHHKEPGISCRARITADCRECVLEMLLRSYAPGDGVSYHDVSRVTGYSTTHCHEIMRCLKLDGNWPFSKPPEKRGRKRRR